MDRFEVPFASAFKVTVPCNFLYCEAEVSGRTELEYTIDISGGQYDFISCPYLRFRIPQVSATERTYTDDQIGEDGCESGYKYDRNTMLRPFEKVGRFEDGAEEYSANTFFEMDNVKIPAIRAVDGGFIVSQVYVVYQDINETLYTREQLKTKQF